jgi:hypothetical protein
MAHLQTDGARVFSPWHNGGMTSRLKRPRDLAQLAKLMIDIASGEVKDHESPQKKTTKRKLPSQDQAALKRYNAGGVAALASDCTRRTHPT